MQVQIDNRKSASTAGENAVIIPIRLTKRTLPAGAKLLWGRCAAQAPERAPEFVFDTRAMAEDLGCHASTICRRKEMLMKRHLLEYTGRKQGRHKIYRLIWDFLEQVGETVKRVLRKLLPRKVREAAKARKVEQIERAPAVLDREQVARALFPRARVDDSGGAAAGAEVAVVVKDEALDWVPDQVRNDRALAWVPDQVRNDRNLATNDEISSTEVNNTSRMSLRCGIGEAVPGAGELCAAQ